MMLSTHQYSKTTIVFLLIVGFLLQSCVRNEIVKAEYLLFDTTKNITIYTTDGRMFHFDEGDYEIVEKESERFLKAEGRQYDERTKFYDIIYAGEIAFADIEKVESRTKTTWGVIGDWVLLSPVVYVGIIVAAVFLIWAASGFKPWGH